MTEKECEERCIAYQELQKLKAEESKTKFHKEKFGNNTIVYCKNKDNLIRYKQLFNQMKKR